MRLVESVVSIEASTSRVVDTDATSSVVLHMATSMLGSSLFLTEGMMDLEFE